MLRASRPAVLAFLIVPLLGVNIRSCQRLTEQVVKKPPPGPAVGKAATAGTKPRSLGKSLADHAVRAQRANLARARANATQNSPAVPPTLANDPDLREGDRLRAAGEFTKALAAYQRGQLNAEARFGKESSESRFFRSRLNFANPFRSHFWPLPTLAPPSTPPNPEAPQAHP